MLKLVTKHVAIFIACLSACATAAVAADQKSDAAGKPNIVYILADDLGYTDIAINGSRYYETPNIDRLARSGMNLTNYHNCQNCAPTRAALMSGQYAPRTGIYSVGDIERFDWQSRTLRPVPNMTTLPPDKITLPQSLKRAGYVTGMFGKWHLGNGADAHPARRGFDEAIVSAGTHFNFKTDPPAEHGKDDYLADWLTDRSVDFIRRHKDQPFFLYLPHYGVHGPLQAKPDLIEKFKDKPAVGGHNNPTYAAMIYSVDQSVGRIMDLLDELKLAENTVVIFSSDNGGVGGYVREGVKDRDTTDNAPLRSGKGSLYEGGTRVPFIVRWPKQVKPGTSCNVPAIHVDIYPTLLEIAGATPPADYKLDGESLAPLFRDPAASLKRDAIFQHFPGYLGASPGKYRTLPIGTLIAGEWKLMEFFEDGRLELYNLNDDPGETKNLATTMPEKAAELRKRMLTWRADVGAKMPTPNTSVETPKAPRKKKKNKSASDE